MFLGKHKPIWVDPERAQSIDVSRRCARMQYRISDLGHRECWAALPPAQLCLHDTWTKIESLFGKDTIQTALAKGVVTNPGYSFDRCMYGRRESDAQPTIIFDSENSAYRRNVKQILCDEAIEVDARGIGLEFYEKGPILSVGETLGDTGAKISGIPQSSSDDSPRRPCGVSVVIGSTTVVCTMGGVISISGELFGLTVGHAFNETSQEKGISLTLFDLQILANPSTKI